MTELNGNEKAALSREYAGPDQGDRFEYKIASLSPRQVEIVRATEDLLSLVAGKRLVVVVYEPPAAAAETRDEKRENQDIPAST